VEYKAEAGQTGIVQFASKTYLVLDQPQPLGAVTPTGAYIATLHRLEPGMP
jgi:hypothetical protein